MRTGADAAVCPAFARTPDRQLRLRSFAFLPAVFATAAAIHAPSALAAPGDLHWQAAIPRAQATHCVVQKDEQSRPRRRAGRRQASARRRAHRKMRSAGRHRPRIVRTARQRPRIVQAGPRLAPDPGTEIVPLRQRSLVAEHPLASDPIIAGPDRALPDDPWSVAWDAAPRCRSAHPSAFALAMASLARDCPALEPAMVEGAWPHCRGARHPQSGWRLAGLGPAFAAPGPSDLTGSPIHWRASADCLAAPLRAVLGLVAAEFGPLTVNSTCRDRRHNARVGGAPRSYHLTGNAVDFRVRSHYREVLAFLSRLRSVGGLTHYGSGVFHIDTGPRRSWGPRRTRVARRA